MRNDQPTTTQKVVLLVGSLVGTVVSVLGISRLESGTSQAIAVVVGILVGPAFYFLAMYLLRKRT